MKEENLENAEDAEEFPYSSVCLYCPHANTSLRFVDLSKCLALVNKTFEINDAETGD